MTTIFITGTNRGIGLELVRQYTEETDAHIFATCRNRMAAYQLNSIASAHPDRVTIITLEVTDGDSIDTAVDVVSQHSDAIDIFVNNAAINPQNPSQDFGEQTAAQMLDILNVNSVAPLMLVQAFADLIKRGDNPRIINISSNMGSIEGRTYGGDYAYCASKAALNMTTRGLAADLGKYGVTTISLDPGWVQTDMGGPRATLTTEESARGVRQVIDGLTIADNGHYYRYDGSALPW